jgi:hypothetical protein
MVIRKTSLGPGTVGYIEELEIRVRAVDVEAGIRHIFPDRRPTLRRSELLAQEQALLDVLVRSGVYDDIEVIQEYLGNVLLPLS